MGLFSVIRQLFCPHLDLKHEYDVGTERGPLGFRPSVWCCRDCGAFIFKDLDNRSADR